MRGNIYAEDVTGEYNSVRSKVGNEDVQGRIIVWREVGNEDVGCTGEWNYVWS